MSLDEFSQPTATKQRLILVEGTDDLLLIQQMCDQEALAGLIEARSYGGVGKLRSFLDALAKGAGFGKVTHIGLTRDSDDSAASALQCLQDAWRDASQTLTSIDRAPPQAFFFALPDNQTKGRIENLCLQAAAFPEILTCAERMYDCAAAVDPQPDAIDREKSIVAAYLSMMHHPGLKLGTGAGAGCWNLNLPVFSPLRVFIRSVAG
jgi:hypothetical protein